MNKKFLRSWDGIVVQPTTIYGNWINKRRRIGAVGNGIRVNDVETNDAL